MGAEVDVIFRVLDAGLAVTIFIGGMRKWYVWGWQYEEAVSRAARAEQSEMAMRNLLLESLGVSQTAIEGLKKASARGSAPA